MTRVTRIGLSKKLQNTRKPPHKLNPKECKTTGKKYFRPKFSGRLRIKIKMNHAPPGVFLAVMASSAVEII
jgi:hypothetical protein